MFYLDWTLDESFISGNAEAFFTKIHISELSEPYPLLKVLIYNKLVKQPVHVVRKLFLILVCADRISGIIFHYRSEALPVQLL